MSYETMPVFALDLFDGAAAGGESGAGASGETQAQTVYGVQAKAADPSDAGKGKETKGTTTKDDPEARRKAYMDMVSGEYKDIHTKEVQRVLNARFKDYKALEQQVSDAKPLLALLEDRYGVKDGDMAKLMDAVAGDDPKLAERAEKNGITREQQQYIERLERQNNRFLENEKAQRGAEASRRQFSKWYSEGEALKETYPDFDLAKESENPEFVSILMSGGTVKGAYQYVHHDDLVNAAVKAATEAREKQVTDNVRARGARPQENGTASKSAFVEKINVSELTNKDMEEISRRVMQGERISFG